MLRQYINNMRWTEFTKTLENLLNENKQLTKSKTKKDSYKKKKVKKQICELFSRVPSFCKIRSSPKNKKASPKHKRVENVNRNSNTLVNNNIN